MITVITHDRHNNADGSAQSTREDSQTSDTGVYHRVYKKNSMHACFV